MLPASSRPPAREAGWKHPGSARHPPEAAEYYADALHNLDIDPAASQDWTIRTYTLSTTPDDSIPVFHPDDFDVEDC